MAGRASRLKTPDRPSRKGILLILHFETDVKRLIKEGKGYGWPRPKRCPNPECRSTRLWGHGYVLRYFNGISRAVWLKAMRRRRNEISSRCRLRFTRGFLMTAPCAPVRPGHMVPDPDQDPAREAAHHKRFGRISP
jgi:hypothetical protein